MTLSDADRAAIAARAEAATPGPWHRHTYGHRDTRSQVRVVGKALREAEAESGVPMTDLSWVHQDPEGPAIALTGNGPRQTENADFIAHARSDIPALLAALSDAQAERDAALRALDEIAEMEPEPVDPLPEHDPGCPECARRRAACWPPSGLCDQLFSEVARRADREERNRAYQHHRMRSIARAALALHRERRP